MCCVSKDANKEKDKFAVNRSAACLSSDVFTLQSGWFLLKGTIICQITWIFFPPLFSPYFDLSISGTRDWLRSVTILVWSIAEVLISIASFFQLQEFIIYDRYKFWKFGWVMFTKCSPSQFIFRLWSAILHRCVRHLLIWILTLCTVCHSCSACGGNLFLPFTGGWLYFFCRA